MSRRRILLVVGCVVALFVLASALPAADPRLDAPGVGSSDGPATGSWDGITDTDDDSPTEQSLDESTETDPVTSSSGEAELQIDGHAEPGSNVTVDVNDGNPFPEDYELLVDGTSVGETEQGGVKIAVPYAEEMTVEVPELDLRETVDVRTDASIEPVDPVAQNRNVTVAATVGSTPVANANVIHDGETVGTTDENGEATVTMPERVGTTELTVERGPVTGEATLDLPAPEVAVTSPLLLPGAPAPVTVTADGVGVPNVEVSALDGGDGTTDDGGSTRVRLPIDNDATIVTEIDGERATATVGNLYLRLTVAVVVLPGLVLGGTWTYIRYLSNRERDRTGIAGVGGISITALFVSFADWLGSLFDALGNASLSDWVPSKPRRGPSASFEWPSLSWPSLSLPRPSAPPVGAMLAGLFASSGGSGSSRSLRSRLGFGDDEDENEDDGRETPSLAAAPLGPPGPRREVRTLWHAFLDRIGVDRRETRAPGQVARRALAAGFPASQVRRLLGVFRDVEYGGRNPSPERVAEARAATEELLDHDPDEEGSE